ncbi:MAG: iron uptake transporter deferrochelatase/peroxidase subunit [Actinomycetaceae bacterium]|nr:iron uptake transporter deferrochelatase/peroxidase subunit [Actinomycetaceae bacterium]
MSREESAVQDSAAVEDSRQADASEATRRGVSRRAVLMGGGLAALGLGTLGGYRAGESSGRERGTQDADVLRLQYPFRGKNQSGITTPQQQQMHLAAYDVVTTDREDLIELLKEWTLAAERMMAGELVNEMKAFKEVPPDDTGETMDLGPAGLSITFGFGATLFETADGTDRFGIADRKPEPLLAEIPRMSAENLDEQRCGGDIVIQACAEDPMVALHAIHDLTRIAFGRATLKWSQLGYGRTSSTSKDQKTPRNLFGFKDGTANVKSEETDVLDEHLWIGPDDPGGDLFAGGTYMACRKIKMMMEVWDELVLSEQENIIGRDKVEGAPLSGGTEFTTPDFGKNEGGEPLIDARSHMALMHPDHNSGNRMLRRGYNYMEGNDYLGRLEGGLFFIAFIRDPEKNFIPILRKMSRDLLTEYLQTTGSALFLIPPGIGDGDEYVGQALFTK